MECKDFSTVNLERSPWVLIETLWNVKTERLSNKTICLRINRNIVECKVTCIKQRFLQIVVLIETLWNVKILHWYRSSNIQTVLIETLWNVKTMKPVPLIGRLMY